MPGRRKRRDRFASGRQLWRLNTLGRPALTDDAEPISSAEASALIAAVAATMEFVHPDCALDGNWGSAQQYENERDSV